MKAACGHGSNGFLLRVSIFFFQLERESEEGKLKGNLKWEIHIKFGFLLCPVKIHQSALIV